MPGLRATTDCGQPPAQGCTLSRHRLRQGVGIQPTPCSCLLAEARACLSQEASARRRLDADALAEAVARVREKLQHAAEEASNRPSRLLTPRPTPRGCRRQLLLEPAQLRPASPAARLGCPSIPTPGMRPAHWLSNPKAATAATAACGSQGHESRGARVRT